MASIAAEALASRARDRYRFHMSVGSLDVRRGASTLTLLACGCANASSRPEVEPIAPVTRKIGRADPAEVERFEKAVAHSFPVT